jgi:purine-nucleoside phosphorylase
MMRRMRALQHDAPDWPLLATRAADTLRAAGAQAAQIGIVLGSGLGPLADEIEARCSVPFAELPGMPPSTAPGHVGRVVCGRLSGREVIAFQGRLHGYEGYDAATCAFPVRVMHALGASSLVASNVCGGLDPHLRAGELLLQLDLLNATGDGALIGPDDGLGERFTVMFDCYDRAYLEVARAAARRRGVQLFEGVYLAIRGPAYATRAELRAYRTLGADAIGMSTVHEVAMARHLGLRVLGLSVVTDMALPEAREHAHGDDVLRMAERLGERFRALVREVLPAL